MLAIINKFGKGALRTGMTVMTKESVEWRVELNTPFGDVLTRVGNAEERTSDTIALGEYTNDLRNLVNPSQDIILVSEPREVGLLFDTAPKDMRVLAMRMPEGYKAL